jgi:hypothetical protein
MKFSTISVWIASSHETLETSIPSILAAKLADRVSGEALSVREIEVLQKEDRRR